MIQINDKRIVLMPHRGYANMSDKQFEKRQKEIQYELDKEESYDDFMDRLYGLQGAKEWWQPWFVEDKAWGLYLNVNVKLKRDIIEPLADRYHEITEGFVWYEMPWGSVWVWYVEPEHYDYSTYVRVFRTIQQFQSFLHAEV